MRDKYLDFAWKKKHTMEHEGDDDANCCWCTCGNPRKTVKRAGRLGNRTCRYHQDYSIIKIGQYTEKRPGDLRRLVVTEAANSRKMSVGPDRTERGKESTGNCARNLNIRTSGICITRNPSQITIRTNFSGILSFKRIT